MDEHLTALSAFEIDDDELSQVFGGFQTAAAPAKCANATLQMDTSAVM